MAWVICDTLQLDNLIKDKDGCASLVCAEALSLDAVTRPALISCQTQLFACDAVTAKLEN